MPTLLVLRGYSFRFRTGDCDERPHAHVTGNGGSAKVWLATVELARFRAYNDHAISEILTITRANASEWLGRWHEVCG